MKYGSRKATFRIAQPLIQCIQTIIYVMISISYTVDQPEKSDVDPDVNYNNKIDIKCNYYMDPLTSQQPMTPLTTGGSCFISLC